MTVEIAHYKCNDNAANTTVTDARSAYPGTASVNTDQLSVSGKISQGFNFNGSTEYVSLGASFPAEQIFSISFWLVDKGTNKTAYIWARNPNGDTWAQLGIVYQGGNLKVSANTAGQTVCSYASLTNGDHLAFVFNHPILNVYKNGNSTPIATLTYGTDFNITTGSPSTSIARAGAYNNYYFDGTLDDIRYYSVALSTAEIATIYNSGNGTESSLTTSYSISGTIKDTNNDNIAGVVVSDGTRNSSPSAADGTYTLADVPNGEYTLTATLAGYSIAPNGWSNPVTVNGSNLTGKDWTGTFQIHSLVIGGFDKIRGSVDNTLDIGSAAIECKDGFFDGTVNIDSLIADTADINAGTVDATIGGTTPAAGTFTTATATTGNITTVNSTTIHTTTLLLDHIGEHEGGHGITLDSNWTAASRTCANLGTVTTADINGGSVDGAVIGASSPAAITGTSITGTALVGTSLDMNGDINLTTQATNINIRGNETTSLEFRATESSGLPTITAHYKCDDNAADTIFTDSKAAYYNGTTARNTSLTSVAGKLGQAMSFNGSSDYVNLNATHTFPIENTFSIAFWLKDKGTDGTRYLWSRLHNANMWALFGIGYSGSNFFVGTSKSDNTANEQEIISTFAAVNSGDHYAFVCNSPNILIYKNGVYVSTVTFTTSGCTTFNNDTTGTITAIGRDGNYNNYYFDGKLDDIRYYSNYQLTASDVEAIYNSGDGIADSEGGEGTAATLMTMDSTTGTERVIIPSLSTTTTKVDHIAESTTSHGIVLDNNWTAAGRTCADLGIVTTADINGGTIDGTNVTVGSGKTLDVSAGTLTLADNQISGDKVEGGTIAAITITTLTSASQITSGNVGSANTGVTATEYGDNYNHVTKLVISKADALTLADAADLGDGYKIYDFPTGTVVIDYAYMTMAITAASTEIKTDTPDVGLGTVEATGAISLLSSTGTFENIITGQTATNCNGTATVKTALPTANVPFVIAAADAHTLFFNAANGWANDTGGDLTADIAGTVVVAWRFLA